MLLDSHISGNILIINNFVLGHQMLGFCLHNFRGNIQTAIHAVIKIKMARKKSFACIKSTLLHVIALKSPIENKLIGNTHISNLDMKEVKLYAF